MKIISFKYFIPAIIFFLDASFLQEVKAQDSTAYNYKTNYEILSELLSKSISKIEDRIILAGKEKTYLFSFYKIGERGDGLNIRGTSPETKLFFQSLILQRLRDYKIITDSNLSYDNKIIVKWPHLRVDYDMLKTKGLIGDKLIRRTCSVEYGCNLETNIAVDLSSFSYSEKYSDEILVDRIPFIEDNNYFFTRAELPHESAFQQILLPAAIILSTAAAVILFFTIRK